MAREIKEMNVNYVDFDDLVSVTAYETKMIKTLRKLAEDHPEEVKIVAENMNGTIVAHLPKKYCRIRFTDKKKSMNYTEEQRKAAADRLKIAREAKNNKEE